MAARGARTARPHAQAFADRLLAPLVSSEAARLLSRLAADAAGAEIDLAQWLLDSEQALIDDELARAVQALDTWADSFALWCCSRDPLLVERFSPLLIAIAARIASAARRADGLVRGRRHPWYAVALVSASAHLASALLALGIYPTLLPGLVEFVGRGQRTDGGWGDEGQASDVLTSLVAADLLSRLDPGFDPAPTVAFLAGQQAADGTWAAAGPDRPWLTAAVATWLHDVELPFAERYRWPTVLPWFRDRRCGIAGYGHFSDLAAMYARLPALCDERVELAFIDLAGFGAWNTTHGQAAGDAVLAAFAAACDEVPASRAMRDGGDEFLLLGAPRRTSLHGDLEALLADWPDRWRTVFGDVPVVPPRVVLARAPAGELVATRERLGRAIGQLKAVTQDVPPTGVLVALEHGGRESRDLGGHGVGGDGRSEPDHSSNAATHGTISAGGDRLDGCPRTTRTAGAVAGEVVRSRAYAFDGTGHESDRSMMTSRLPPIHLAQRQP